MNNTASEHDIAALFEEKVHADLFSYLQTEGAVDSHLPECPDVEELWPVIARAYMPDGAREFQNYPTVSLGWIMFIGMAMAQYWDTDWARYSAMENIYLHIRELRGYDNLDDAVIEDVIGLKDKDAEKLSALAGECASRVYNMLCHEHVEPGTPAAMGCYIAALHQLYLAGMAVQLKTLGYHMVPLN